MIVMFLVIEEEVEDKKMPEDLMLNSWRNIIYLLAAFRDITAWGLR